MEWRGERAAAGLSVGLLGPAVIGGEHSVMTPIGQQMLRVLVGLLGVADGRSVSVAALIDGLWEEEWSPGREKNLHSRISALRRLLEETEPGRGASRLVRAGEGYLLKLDPGCLDIQRFRLLSGQGREAVKAGAMADAAAMFRAALSLWRGPALDDVAPFCSRLAAEAASLEEARASVVEDRLDCDLALGRHGELVAELTALVRQYPLRERLTGQLMVTLWRCGRRGEALAAYANTRRVLTEELGLDPGPALRELHARVLADDQALAFDSGPAAPRVGPAPPVSAAAVSITAISTTAVTAKRGRLPAPVASFVGREAELTELVKLTGRHRLVTITGPGGAGKTRLAIQVAASLASDHRDGSWFVDLSEVDDPAGVPAAVAAALGMRLALGEPVMRQLLDRTAGMQAMLVVDNCEHLVDEVASTVEGVLENSPGVRVLATSRQPLLLPGEDVWETPPIAYPSDQHRLAPSELAVYDAVRLFIERMPQRGDIAADLRTIAAITATLEGLPLAIELAAASAARFGLTELARMLSDRVGTSLLRSRTGRRRQQTLDATIGWSYDLLSPELRSALRRLSVFPAGFTLEAAAAVTGARDVAAIADALAERSLILVDRGKGHDERPRASLRYRMLETIRQFCAARIVAEDGPDEDAVLRGRHARYIADLAARAAPALACGDQGRWLTELEADYANLVSALEHLLAQPGNAEDALLIIIPLHRFWQYRGHLADCARFARRALELAEEDLRPDVRCRALTLLGEAISRHEPEAARGYLTEALTIARDINDARATAKAMCELSWVRYVSGEHEDSARFGAQALEIARVAGDPVLLAECLVTSVFSVVGRAGYAAESEALDVASRCGDRIYVAVAHANLGNRALEDDDFEAARHHLEQAEKFFGALGIAYSSNLTNLGFARLRQSDATAAQNSFAEALRVAELQNSRHDASFAILGLACVAVVNGDAERAARLFGFADGEISGCGVVWLDPEKTYRELWLAEAAEQLGPEYEGLYNSVRGADRGDLVDYALSADLP